MQAGSLSGDVTPVKRILVVAGEASGDILASALIKACHARSPGIQWVGIGGARMREQGVKTAFDITQMAVVGATEIARSLGIILRAYRWVRQQFQDVDAVLLVDYPGFNLRVAKKAKQAGLRVFYYVSPTVWAWHPSRMKTIQAAVDHMFVILPFEVAIYQKAGVPVTLLRHPLLDMPSLQRDKAACCAQYGLCSHKPILLLMPGSRKQEVLRLWPAMQEAIKTLRVMIPDLQVICAQAPHLADGFFQTGEPVAMIKGDNAACLKMADAACCASGTATLELALAGIPMVVVYRVGFLTYHLAKYLLKLPYIALCNIILQDAVVPELIQTDANANNIANYVRSSLLNTTDRSKMKASFSGLRAQFDSAQSLDVASDVLANFTESVSS